MTSKSLRFFKFKLDVHDKVPEIFGSVQIFIYIRSAGFSADNCRMLRFCNFSWLYCIFSLACTQVKPVDKFSHFMAHTMCFRPKTVLLGIATISEFI